MATNNWELQQYDIKTALLNGDLDEEIFMEIPKIPSKFKDYINSYLKKKNNLNNRKQLERLLQTDKKKVLKLNKALYGLKQASREWFK